MINMYNGFLHKDQFLINEFNAVYLYSNLLMVHIIMLVDHE